jgi:hypothetical protein
MHATRYFVETKKLGRVKKDGDDYEKLLSSGTEGGNALLAYF